MTNWRFLSFICFIILQLNSCSIEEAKKEKKEKLVVLSDYLESKDSIIFKAFKEQRNVGVEIIQMSTRELIQMIRNEKYTAKADIVMVKSMFDVHRLSQQSIFQKIVFSNELNEKQKKHISTDYNYFGIGIDPFVNVILPNVLLPGQEMLGVMREGTCAHGVSIQIRCTLL